MAETYLQEKNQKENKKEEKKQSPQSKYREVAISIQMLSLRAMQENNIEAYEKLKRLGQYLEEVRMQRNLCLISEKDRPEKARYKELLEYIDKNYNGSKESLAEICKSLNKRKDIDEVLKYYDKKNNKSKEEER